MMQKTGMKDPDAVRQEIERFDAAHIRVHARLLQCRARGCAALPPRSQHRPDAGRCLRTGRSASWPGIRASRITLRRSRRSPTNFWRRKVSSALGDEISASIAPLGVSVSADNGRVTLVGMSSSGKLRARAEKVVAQIAGVCAIDNRIISVPSSRQALSGARTRPVRFPHASLRDSSRKEDDGVSCQNTSAPAAVN